MKNPYQLNTPENVLRHFAFEEGAAARDKEWVEKLKYVNQATDLKDLDARFQFLLKDMGVSQ